MKNLKPIPGLDITEGIKQHGGNQENYLKVLRSFMVSTKTKLDLLKDTNNLKQYETTVHGIKGASRGICAEDIGNKAFELEKAAEKGDTDFIQRYNSIFIENLTFLLNNLEEMFNNMDSKITKQKKDSIDKLLLIKLMEACEIYDMMEVEAAMTEISKYQYNDNKDEVLSEYLQRCTEEMQYDQIAERLSAVIK